MLKTAFCLICSLLTIQLIAQAPHFSNLQYAPLQLNPALTGVMPNESNARLVLQHRNQWQKVLDDRSYRTSTASFDYRFCSSNSYEYFSAGVSLLHDQAGDANFTTQQAKLNLAYLHSFIFDTYISLGVEGGMINYNLSDDDLRYDSQFDGFGGFDSTLPTNERFAQMQAMVIDWGIGLEVFRVLDEDAGHFFSFGGTIKHATRPGFSFLEEVPAVAAELQPLWRGSLRLGAIHLGKDIRLNGTFIYAQQGKFQQLYAQPDLRISLGDNFKYQLLMRPALRLTNRFDRDLPTQLESLIINFGFDNQRLMVQAAYDINLSKLRVASTGRGGVEVTAVIYIQNDSGCDRVYCPAY